MFVKYFFTFFVKKFYFYIKTPRSIGFGVEFIVVFRYDFL